VKRITTHWRLVGDALQLGASIVFAIFIGFGIGYWLDGKVGTTPWLTIVFFLLGVAAAGRNVLIEVRKQLRSQKTTDEDKEPK
jgi:ATP synthase protein I